MKAINVTITYLKTGYLLHIITLAELVLLYVLLHVLHAGQWMLERDTALRFMLLLPLLWSPLFPQLDARSRYQDYKMAMDCFYLYGFDERLVRHFAKSRCQRDAVLVAAARLGFGNECKNCFAGYGYRWYHILPDVVFKKPVVLLSWAFYRHTFFAKTYHSKTVYNFLSNHQYGTPALQVKAA